MVLLLGVDNEWATLDHTELSLFPGTTGVAVLVISFPKGSPAGPRRVTLEVSEITEPFDTQVIDLDLEIPSEPALSLKLDPVSVNAGRRTSVTAILANTGNVTEQVEMVGVDDEAQVHFAFTPAKMPLVPGESRAVSVNLKAKRPLTGSPKVRPFTLKANSGAPEAPAAQTFGSMVQKPWLSRGHIALIGLLLAATVFATVLAVVLGQINANESNDSNTVMQAVDASLNASASGGTGSASISGLVGLVSAPSKGQGGVTVDLFTASNTANPVASTATQSDGDYAFAGLAPGAYRLEFAGAGLAEVWYPDSATPQGANTVQLNSEQQLGGINVSLGGLPATISGTVTGPSPTGATVALQASSSNPDLNAAVVASATTDTSGDFILADVPSPADYQLVVTKSGYATATQAVNVASGQDDTGITMLLELGDGFCCGHGVIGHGAHRRGNDKRHWRHGR